MGCKLIRERFKITPQTPLFPSKPYYPVFCISDSIGSNTQNY